MKKYRIVTIDREYASGGREVAQKLGKLLELPVYGKELTQYIAQQIGIPSEGEKDQEKPTNSLLYSLNVFGQLYRGELVTEPEKERMKHAEKELVGRLADHQSCIVLGRCAGWILRERKDVLSVFIVADQEIRRERAIREYGVEESQAKSVIAKYDRKRAGYYHEITGGNWNERNGYHMVLDTGKLGIEVCAQTISDLFEASKG